MAIKDITSKCWILALFIRDDGERFLLGDGNYEFDEKQLHFAANTMANDVVEVQGNDGYLLAGQVRRPGVQSFDGYIGDSSTPKATIETHRQAFFSFFRKNYFYTVVYVFPDGTAIQRKRGFLVDAPVAQELYQIYPKYHVALNFEDINYYYYDEDASGTEIYGKSATITLNSIRQTGGLVWVDPGEIELSGEGTSFTLMNTVNGTALTSAELKGDTTQQTYSGKNLFNFNNGTFIIRQNTSNTSATYDDNNTTMTAIGTTGSQFVQVDFDLDSTKTYTVSGIGKKIVKGTSGQPYITVNYVYSDDGSTWSATQPAFSNTNPTQGEEYPFSFQISGHRYYRIRFYNNRNTPVTIGEQTTYYNMQIELGSTVTSYEPYVGGTASPNPDYPQEVQTVTGRQVVTITNGGSQSQEYEVNLGKNLFDKSNISWYRNNDGAFSDTSDTSTTRIRTNSFPIAGGKTYTISGIPTDITLLNIRTYAVEGGPQTTAPVRDGNTFTFSENTKYIHLLFGGENFSSATNTMMANADIQLELGSTATSYAPYFEPIELCKIGDYQDYIYKSGSDWYVHKAVGKYIFTGTENWWRSSATVSDRYGLTLSTIGINNPVRDIGLSSHFVNAVDSSVGGTSSIVNDTLYICFPLSMNLTTVALAKNWLTSNNVTLYYALATPTDTQITNADLIAQLEAVAGATTYARLTTFVTQSQNLPAILAVEADGEAGGGVEWDADGAVWEEGQSSYSTVVVESIDNIYPILTITGRTVNPVITDVTTGTIFQYNGTITESQVLKVDMMNKTATLNGTSVVGNVSGDWLFLQPGNNKITYTADNATAPNATIEWQEIVG